MNARCGIVGFVAFLIFGLSGSFMKSTSAASPGDSPPEAWKPIQDAINQGLPKSAIEAIAKQLPIAIQRNDHDFVVRLLATRATLDGQLEGRDEVHRIIQLQSDLSTAPAPTRPVLRAILANWFWSYYSQNQWRFRDRSEIDPELTTTEGDEQPVVIKSSADIATWTRNRIMRQSAALFELALNADDGSEKLLRETPIGNYTDLLVKGTAPDEYRPTLYDFVVADAIDFYTGADETYAGPAARFELGANTPIYADVENFIAWQVPAEDTRSPLRRATILYQDWLAFHVTDTDPTALLDTDLNRLEFAKAHAIGDGYEAAMQSFAVRHAKHPLSTQAQYKLASLARENNDPVRAHQIATTAINAFPDSFGATQCRALIKEIEEPSIEIATEQIWNPELDEASQPTIDLKYRNITKVYFRLVPLDFEALRASGRHAQHRSPEQNRELVMQTPIASWSQSLAATEDYRDRSEQLAARLQVPRGAYYLIASTSDGFPLDGDYTAITDVWVSGISLIVESRHTEGKLVGYVLDGRSGQPVANASIEVWARKLTDRRVGEQASVETLKTDKDGRFEFVSESYHDITFTAVHGKDKLWSQSYHLYRRGGVDERERNRSHFFTDRSIYRPGQILRYKVICTRANQLNNQYAVAGGQQVTIELFDANNKIVHSAQHRTNDMGSFHGSVNLPAAGLTGRMMLRTSGEFQGATAINVEEYKRPKFEVKLDAPTDPVRLGENVTIAGHATAYTSAAIDGAKVSYRVIRKTQLPPWWWYRCWWMPPSPMPEQTIAEGETQTDALGNFLVTFTAVPDNSIDRESEPKFRYEITADVTDLTGETRDGSTSVLVGYTMMEATLSTSQPEWLTDEKPVSIKVATRTLQGGAVSAPVTVKVFSLKQPDSIGRQSLGNLATWRLPDADDQKDTVRPEEPNSWPIDQVIKTIEMTTDAEGNASFDVSLDAGHFRAELSSVDSAGQAVSAFLPLRVIDPDAENCTLKTANLFAVEQSTVEPGEEFRAVWGSGYDTAVALVEVLHRGKTLQRYWTPKNRTQVEVVQAVDESMRGGFTVRVWMVRENRLYVNETRVNVPWSNKELTIRWERFVSKLKPGQQEKWTAIIEDPTGDGDTAMRRAAEMVATLYDASLDAFQPHNFTSGFGVFYQDYSHVSVNDQNQWEYLQRISVYRSLGRVGELTYRQYPPELQGQQLFGRTMMRSRRGGVTMDSMMMADEAMPMAAAPMMMAKGMAAGEAMELGLAEGEEGGMGGGGEPPADKPEVDLSDVAPRKNLNETAFFFPELTADENGVVSMSFTMPEALTRWQLIGFAHTADLAGGLIRDTAVTSKELMVQPNPPRVLREGDEIQLTVKVSNQSATVQTGTVAMQFSDARTGESVDAGLSNTNVRQSFEIAAGRSQTFSWPIRVPDGMGFLTYKAVGSTGRLSDGEEGYLPVLSRKILVHESIALPIDGAETKTFTLDKLATLDPDSIRNESLTVQMTSNPAWYAVMALPYLMDYPHECSEQTFNRLYANLLARHIATSDPRIERVFETWRNQPLPAKGEAGGRDPLASPLQQNEQLASIALTETPWVLEAESEAESRRNVGILFDQNRVNEQVQRLTKRLIDLQLEDGSWAWFPGGRSSDFITLYLATGYGRLRHLGVDVDTSPAIRSLAHLDAFSRKMYADIKPEDRSKNHSSATIALYLYGRSFFLKDAAVAPESQAALSFWLDQTEKHWLSLPRMSQAHAAVALKRFGRAKAAMAIVASLKERSRHRRRSECIGMMTYLVGSGIKPISKRKQ